MRFLTSKSTIVVISLILLNWFIPATGQTPTVKDQPSPMATKTQYWNGTIQAGAEKLRVIFRIDRDDDGKLSATMKSIDQSDEAMKIDEIAFHGGTLTLKIKSIRGEFEGKLTEDKGQIEGTWTQFGRPMPLSLRRGNIEEEWKLFETWQGDLVVGTNELKLQFRRLRDKEGKEKVLLDSLTQRAMGIQGELKVDGQNVELKFPAIAASYRGTLNDAGDRATGKWLQGGGEFDFEVSKVDKADEVPAVERPQHPKKPYPYREQGASFSSLADGVTLAGTLTLPDLSSNAGAEGGENVAATRFPAVVLVSGSGPQDRDETLMEHKPFLVIADHLTRHGIAVLRYDDRGVGDSTGTFESATTEDFVDDVLGAVTFLQSHAEIDAERIGIIGHSEGGLIAPMASLRTDLAHIVLLAGPGVDGGEIIMSQSEAMARVIGQSEDAIQANESFLKKVVTAIRSGASQEEIHAIVDEEVTATREATESSDDQIKSLRATALAASAGNFSNEWFRFFVNHDPAKVLRQVKTTPVLALIGEKDLQVLVDLNMPRIEQSLQMAGNPDYRCESLAGLNHLFQECTTGSPSEYATITQTISPKALEMLTEWVRAH